MTNRTFLSIGLILIVLSAVWATLETLYILSSTGSYNLTSEILRTLGIPFMFAVILWHRLSYLGKNRLQSASLVALYIVFAILGIWSSISFALNLQDFHPMNALMPDYIAWAMAGKEGTLPLFSVFKVSLFNGFIATLMSLPLLLGLILGTNGPKTSANLLVQ